MSVVVAIKKKGIVYVGADSQATCGGSKVSLKNPNNYKIWPVKGVDYCLMGAVGDLRDSCVIRTLDNLVDRLDAIDDLIDYDYVVNIIEPIIRQVLIEHKFIPEENPYDSLMSTFLFIYKDRMYTIVNGAVIEHDDHVAIGSGSSEAMGSLISTENEDDPNLRIIQAIKASEGHDLYVGYPIVITNSYEPDRFAIIDEKTTQKILTPPKKPRAKRPIKKDLEEEVTPEVEEKASKKE